MVLEKRLKIDQLTDDGQSVVMKFFWLTLIFGALNIISTILLKLRQKLIGDIEKISMDGEISHEQIMLLNKLAGVMNELIIDQVTEEDLKIKRHI